MSEISRRTFFGGALVALFTPRAFAGPVPESLSQADAAQAVRDLLQRSAKMALARAGRENGFWLNPQIRIGLLKNHRKADKVLRMLGYGQQVDAFVLGMNRAAEMALSKAEGLIQEQLGKWSAGEARTLLTGPGSTASAVFYRQAEAALVASLRQKVREVADKSGLTSGYSNLAATLMRLANIASDQDMVEEYVSQKAAAGFFVEMAEAERTLRQTPAQWARGSAARALGMPTKPES